MKSAQNIWIITKYASSREYGFESRLFALARKFVSMGRSMTIISSDSNHLAKYPTFRKLYNREKVDGADVHWIRTLKYQRTASLRRILSWLDFEIKLFLMPKKDIENPNVIIVSSLSLLTILNGIWLKRKYKCKLIFEIRDIWPLTLVAEGGFDKHNPFVLLLGWIERKGYEKSDLIVGTMPNLTSHVTKVTGKALPCCCVPFGFEPSFFEQPGALPDGFSKRYIPSGKFVVGYAGSVGLTNALETLIESAKRLSNDDRFFFMILGDGDMREKFISDTSGMANIVFIPKVERDQVQAILQLCDLLYFAVYDSEVWEYGLSLNKLIDYMMASKPVVASYSGYQSMLNEAGSGLFIPSADVEALIDTLYKFVDLPREEMIAMGASGREWLINNRNWDALAQEYLKHCDSLIEQ